MKINNNAAKADEIVTRITARDERGDFGRHISDLTACLRRRWLDHYQPTTGPSPLGLTFLRGTILHEALSGHAEEVKREVDGLLGTVDHIDDDGLWEWKTTMIWAGKLDDPTAWPESWLMQMAAYCYMHGTLIINVGVLHLQGDGRSNRLACLRVYRIEFTPEESLANWKILRERSEVLTWKDLFGLHEPVEPPVHYRLGAWECRNCPHLSHCLPELKLLGDKVKEAPDGSSS